MSTRYGWGVTDPEEEAKKAQAAKEAEAKRVANSKIITNLPTVAKPKKGQLFIAGQPAPSTGTTNFAGKAVGMLEDAGSSVGKLTGLVRPDYAPKPLLNLVPEKPKEIAPVAPAAPAPAVQLRANPDRVEEVSKPAAPAVGLSDTNQRYAKASGVSQSLIADALAPDVLTKYTPAAPVAPAPAPVVASPKPPAAFLPPAELGSIHGGTLIRSPAQPAPMIPEAAKPSVDAQIAKLMAPYQGNTGIIPSSVSQQLLELERQKTKSTPETRQMAEELDRSRGAALADKAVASADERRSLEQRAKVAGIKPEVQAANEKAAKEVAEGRASEQKKVETEAGAKVAAARGAGVEAATTEAASREAVAKIAADVSKANSLAELEKLTKAAELDANSPINKAQVDAIRAKTAHLPEEDRLEMMKVQLQLAAFQNQQQKEAAAAAQKARESEANIGQSQAKTEESGQNAIEKARENALAAAGFTKQTDPETKAIRWFKGNVLVEPGSEVDRQMAGIQAQFGTSAPAPQNQGELTPDGKFIIVRDAQGKAIGKRPVK